MKDLKKVTVEDVVNALVNTMAEELIANDGNYNADSCLAIESVVDKFMNEDQKNAFMENVENVFKIMTEEE